MTDTIAAAHKVFRVLGTTDEVTMCELCGRDELKGTIVLDELDEDGNATGNIVYYGASCGARAAGWTTKEVRKAAEQADDAKREVEREAQRAAFEANRAEWLAARDAWIAENIGPNAMQDPGRYGLRNPVEIVRAFHDATGM